MMKIKPRKIKLALAFLLAGSVSANAQYNVDYKMGNYIDPRGVESTVPVGEGEVVTVGSMTFTKDGFTQADVVLTRLDKEGRVLWNLRYGLEDHDEYGNGITLSWDKRHVIVVGSDGKAKGDGSIPEMNNALVLKVRISDGALIWSTNHGQEKTDEKGYVVKRSTGFEADIVGSYIVVGTSEDDPDQSFERMYAFKVKDDGNESWNRRYYLPYNFPISSIRPTSMVENGVGRFMIAGIRTEINRPDQLFTVGIRTSDGALTDALIHYASGDIYTFANVDIDKDPEGEGYALSFRSLDYYGECADLAGGTTINRIGAIRLNDDRAVKWANIYWEPGASNQGGFSMYFYKDELRVCVNINRPGGYNTPGILRLKSSNGTVLSCNTYHVPETFTDRGPLSNNMVFLSSNDYYVKGIYRGWGFQMSNPDISTKANCDRLTEIKRCEIRVEEKKEECEPKEYGRYAFVDKRVDRVDYGEDPCLDFEGARSPEDQGAIHGTNQTLNKAIVYPSPVGASQDVLNLRFTTDMENVDGVIQVFNSQGQVVLNHTTSFINGENNISFEAQSLVSGMYLVVISGNGQQLDQVKFIKE